MSEKRMVASTEGIIRHWGLDDKSKWGDGPWQKEPDKIQWVDAATGLPCLVVRSPTSGALCGYVGVAPGHPWHGKSWDDADIDVRVHGGLTFAGPCMEEGGRVCHIPAPGEPDNTWWQGFDCGHGMDFMPALEARLSGAGHASYRDARSRYRDLAYVRAEVTELAQQAAEIAEVAP